MTSFPHTLPYHLAKSSNELDPFVRLFHLLAPPSTPPIHSSAPRYIIRAMVSRTSKLPFHFGMNGLPISPGMGLAEGLLALPNENSTGKYPHASGAGWAFKE